MTLPPHDDQQQRRERERRRLQERIVTMLRADTRIVAAWLGGSHGRGTVDAWSDLDLWVVVADDQSAAVMAARRDFVAAAAPPVVLLEAPENAPPGGAYLLTLYEGDTGAHQVDWYWLPRAKARLPRDFDLLFDRVGLPAMPPPTPLTASRRAEALTERTAQFWVSLALAAKAVARRRPWSALRMIDWTMGIVREIEWLVTHGTMPTFDDVKELTEADERHIPPTSPVARLAHLHELIGRMETLTPILADLGADTPAEGADQVKRLLNLIEDESQDRSLSPAPRASPSQPGPHQ